MNHLLNTYSFIDFILYIGFLFLSWLTNRVRKGEMCGEWLETVGRAGFVRARPSVKGKRVE